MPASGCPRVAVTLLRPKTRSRCLGQPGCFVSAPAGPTGHSGIGRCLDQPTARRGRVWSQRQTRAAASVRSALSGCSPTLGGRRPDPAAGWRWPAFPGLARPVALRSGQNTYSESSSASKQAVQRSAANDESPERARALERTQAPALHRPWPARRDGPRSARKGDCEYSQCGTMIARKGTPRTRNRGRQAAHPRRCSSTAAPPAHHEIAEIFRRATGRSDRI